MDLEAYLRQIKLNRFIPAPPAERMFVGGTPDDFRAIGVDTLRSLIKHCKLDPAHKVLDVGSGIGRIALPLTQWLDERGAYLGFEVVADGVDWCRDEIASRYPNFEFRHVDLHNDYYNPGGPLRVESLRVDRPEKFFDLAIFCSVFTHLDAADTEAYFALARRHLAPAGRIWGTWFLMDADARAAVARGETTLGFILRDDAPTFHLGEGQSPSYAVAYDFDFACAAYARHGFEIELIQKGHWCNRSHKTGGGYQDLIVARMG